MASKNTDPKTALLSLIAERDALDKQSAQKTQEIRAQLAELPVGTIFSGQIPYEVRETKEGVKYLHAMISKRALAVQQGLEVGPMTTRKRGSATA